MANMSRKMKLLLFGLLLAVIGVVFWSSEILSALLSESFKEIQLSYLPQIVNMEFREHFIKNNVSDYHSLDFSPDWKEMSDVVLQYPNISRIVFYDSDATVLSVYSQKGSNYDFGDKHIVGNRSNLTDIQEALRKGIVFQHSQKPKLVEFYFLVNVPNSDKKIIVNVYYNSDNFIALISKGRSIIIWFGGAMCLVLLFIIYFLIKKFDGLLLKYNKELETSLDKRTLLLSASEKKYSNLINNIREGVYAFDENGMMTIVNKRLAEIFGYSQSEILGKHFSKFFPKSEADKLKFFFRRAKENIHNAHRFIHTRGLCKDGRVVDIDIYLTAVEKTGKFIGSQGFVIDISSIRKMESVMQRSERTFRTLFEESKDAIIIADSNSKVLEWNDSATRMFGYTAMEMIGKTMDKIVPRELRSLHKKSFAIASMNNTLKNKGRALELSAIRKDGTKVFIELTLAIIKVDGDIDFVAIIRDITRRKKKESELIISERKFRTFVEDCQGIVFMIDQKGVFTLSEGKGLSVLGLKSGEVVGRSALKMYEKYPDIIRGIRGALDGKMSRDIIKMDKIYFDIYFTPIKNINDKTIGVQGMAIDVTEQFEAVEKIQNANETNIEILKNAPFGVILFDISGNVSFVNDALLQISSDTREQIMGMNAFTIKSYKKYGLDKKLKSVFINKSKVSIKGFEYVSSFGKKRTIRDIVMIPILISGKNYVLMTVIDQTEQFEYQKRIKELNVLRNKFIKIVSHQLRTPLNAIRWNTELLISGDLGKLATPQKKVLEALYEAEDNIIKRINDLLVVMDIEEGRVVLEKEKISMVSLFNGLLPQFLKNANKKKIKLLYQRNKNKLPLVNTDVSKIRVVITQLLLNAIAYTKPKGKITIKITKKKGNLRFTIADTGIGIPSIEQKRIFTKFYRASNASSMLQDASGIGLSIVKYYIDQHGGVVGFTSKEGKGSTFFFELPIAK